MEKKIDTGSPTKVKQVLLQMGSLLSDYGYSWSKEMKSSYNKALSYLEREENMTTS